MDLDHLACWRYALKPASWPKLLVPAGLGHAIGIAESGRVDVAALLLGLALTLGLLVFIVLLNDWGDQEVDRLKRRLFEEECSPKTIPDGILGARSVLYAGVGFAAVTVGLGVFGEVFLGRTGLGFWVAACVGIFAAYSLPPIALNYRGGGEFLEMLGVGLVLPLMCAYVQSGEVLPAAAAVLPPLCLLALSSALASGLSDEESDRLGGKVTFATLLGNEDVRRATESLALAGMTVWAALPVLAPGVVSLWFLCAALVVMAFQWRSMRLISELAVTGAFAEQRLYKEYLHQCIWYGAALIALGVLVAGAGR